MLNTKINNNIGIQFPQNIINTNVSSYHVSSDDWEKYTTISPSSFERNPMGFEDNFLTEWSKYYDTSNPKDTK